MVCVMQLFEDAQESFFPWAIRAPTGGWESGTTKKGGKSVKLSPNGASTHEFRLEAMKCTAAVGILTAMHTYQSHI